MKPDVWGPQLWFILHIISFEYPDNPTELNKRVYYDFYTSLDLIKEGDLEGKVLILGAIANFFVFFIFLKKKQIYRARGVLIETFFIAFLVLLLTLFSK